MKTTQAPDGAILVAFRFMRYIYNRYKRPLSFARETNVRYKGSENQPSTVLHERRRVLAL